MKNKHKCCYCGCRLKKRSFFLVKERKLCQTCFIKYMKGEKLIENKLSKD